MVDDRNYYQVFEYAKYGNLCEAIVMMKLQNSIK